MTTNNNCEDCDWSRYSCNLFKYPCGSETDCPKENSNESQIVKYQSLYYLGLGWGIKTFCWRVYEKDNERWIVTNCNTHRKESEVISNSCDLFTSKENINSKLATMYMSKLIP